MNWPHNARNRGKDRSRIHENVEATVIEMGECSKIHENNESDKNTILIHIDNADYIGFDGKWVKNFTRKESFEKCRDEKCMFIVCGETLKYQIAKL